SFSARIFAFLPFNCNDRSTDATARGPLRHVFAPNIEFVSRREVVQRWVPLGSWIRFVCHHKIALQSWNCQRPAPWIEFCIVNDLKNAADAKIVIANCRWIVWIAFQFVRRGMQRRETV